ncbi:MAG TPA: Ig-like domain-containing protein [Gemmatimonadales bacterium]
MKRMVAVLFLGAGACFGNTDDSDGSAPVVVITSPTGTEVSGSVSFAATVIDDFGVEEVEFFAGNISLLQDRLPPYAVQWATINFPDGPIQIRVIARDYSGNSSQAAKTVTVNNAPD